MVMTTPALQPLLARVEQVFRENFTNRDELGASVSIWHGGEEVLALASGFCDREQTRVWNHESTVPFWSATKGLSAACILHLLDRSDLGLDDKVARVWPEFARAGTVSYTHLRAHEPLR